VVEVHPFPPGSPTEIEVARTLAARSERRDEHPALGDDVWRDLRSPARGSAGFSAVPVGAGSDPEPVGYLRVVIRPDDPPGATLATLAMTVHPDHRDDAAPGALLDAGLAHAGSVGATTARLWTFGADVDADALAAGRGLSVVRELWQMRTLLPVAGTPRLPPGVALTPFVSGADDAEWLALNARAFASDPDQGSWTNADLTTRLGEDWFSPAGFLVARRAGRIVGSCWTKVHPPDPPHEPHALGEIYVIGVDPSAHGEGLGRALVLAGLAHLHRHGIGVGMLFVDAANAPAVSLYRSLGFVTSRIDRAYGTTWESR